MCAYSREHFPSLYWVTEWYSVTRVCKHKPCTRVFLQLVLSSPKLKLVYQLLWSVTLLLTVISAIGLLMFLSMQPLSLKTYAARFSTLLFAEELQMEVDMREFDMERVRILFCWSDVLIVSRWWWTEFQLKDSSVNSISFWYCLNVSY